LRDHGVLVRPELLAQLNLRVGDDLLIGAQRFQIRGVIQSEPGRNLGAFSLGSRVFIDLADLPSTGLLSFGSRASYQLLLQVPSPPPLPGRRDPSLVLATELSKTFVNDFIGVRSYRQNEGRMNQNLSRAENYLSLVGLVVLILGGIGVSSVTRVFVQQKVRSIAILKCVGSSSRQVLAIYLTQVVLLGLAGSALGVAIAAGVLQLLPLFVGNIAALLQVDYGLTVGAVLQGLAVGVLVSLLFSVVPLLEVRNVKPSLLLRQDIPSLPQFDWLKWTVATAVGAALVGVAAWQAGSVQVGLLLSAGFVALTFVLHLAGVALIRAVQPLRFARSFALRQAVLHVARPGNQTRIILLAVGLGTFFILGVRALQVNLLQDFSVQVGDDAPDMFLMDIQTGQRAGLTALIDRENGAENAPKLIPVLRARITAVRGRDVNLESYEDVRGRGGLSREFTITYRPQLEANEKLVDGKWWDATPAADTPEVSIEESLRNRFNIQIGDEMRFDVLGRIVTARVTSFREVDFRDFRAGGFMIVFRPGPFDNAPHNFIAAVRGGKDPVARARLQGLIVADYPNISVIDLREVLDTIKTIVDNVTLAVTVVGALVLLSGSLILIGAVSMTKFRRVYEAAILKTLGASSRLIATMLLLEYGVLGAIAGTVGAAGADRPELGRRALRARSPVAAGTVSDDRRNHRHGGRGRRDRRARKSRCPEAQAALDAPSGVGVQSPLVLGDKRPPGEARVNGRRDIPGRAAEEARGAPSRLRGEAPAMDDGEQLRQAGRHGRPGRRQQRSPHSAQTQTDRRQNPASDRRRPAPNRGGFVRGLQGVRRADR
jgi:putative ABC transport system permease protein